MYIISKGRLSIQADVFSKEKASGSNETGSRRTSAIIAAVNESFASYKEIDEYRLRSPTGNPQNNPPPPNCRRRSLRSVASGPTGTVAHGSNRDQGDIDGRP